MAGHVRHTANCIQVISLGRGLHCHGPTSLGRGLRYGIGPTALRFQREGGEIL